MPVLPRGLVVRRLLERQQAGELATRHVRAVAETVGVSERTVWRWLEQAKTSGQVEAPVRQGYAVSDEVWALLGEVGGNVAELRRRLAAAGGGASVPSASTLHRVIRRDRRAGRALTVGRESVVAGPSRPDPLSELGLNVVAEKGVGGQVFLREQKHLAQVPDAQVVHTPAVRSVLRTVAHAAAVGAVVCLYGDAGQGKTVALQYALSQLPHPARVRRVHVGVHPTVPELRRVLGDALELGRRLPRGAGEGDLMLVNALRQRVCWCWTRRSVFRGDSFEYFRYLWDEPATQLAIIFVGGEGCHTVLRREPMLSSRVFIWQHFTRLTPGEVLEAIPLFHPVWAGADPDDIAFADRHAAHGNFRAWAQLTAHIRLALARTGRPGVDRDLLRWAFSRLGPAA
ncbi:ATP-binding protein [Streptomyces tendae]|uniref:ATP-binding protein n=1 Tax=Streptomyces tendae TaxID=1932 RepID=UPI003441A4E8